MLGIAIIGAIVIVCGSAGMKRVDAAAAAGTQFAPAPTNDAGGSKKSDAAVIPIAGGCSLAGANEVALEEHAMGSALESLPLCASGSYPSTPRAKRISSSFGLRAAA